MTEEERVISGLAQDDLMIMITLARIAKLLLQVPGNSEEFVAKRIGQIGDFLHEEKKLRVNITRPVRIHRTTLDFHQIAV